jgi:hypothetical protein
VLNLSENKQMSAIAWEKLIFCFFEVCGETLEHLNISKCELKGKMGEISSLQAITRALYNYTNGASSYSLLKNANSASNSSLKK